ncbi:MAG: glycine cleavage T C-terminal barrel domain-containing protein, partial [Chloroflexota bacterium]|nr:glycine cleavage T C-terminal barrel domain-containing protein [Chloroflexota bacterium]
PDYVAGDALIQLLSTEPHRLLVGFKMIGRGIPRPDLKILSCSPEESNSSVIGNVTSGTYSPTVDCGIGMGYVDRKYSKVGNHIVIDVRGRLVAAEIVKLPFYKPF